MVASLEGQVMMLTIDEDWIGASNVQYNHDKNSGTVTDNL